MKTSAEAQRRSAHWSEPQAASCVRVSRITETKSTVWHLTNKKRIGIGPEDSDDRGAKLRIT